MTIPLALVILFAVGIFPLLASGPHSYSIENLTDNCRDNWWSALLYVNNYVETSEEHCLRVTWYLACDTQMFILAPLLLYPMYRWSRNHLGLAVWGAFMLLFTGVPIGLSAKYKLPPGFMV